MNSFEHGAKAALAAATGSKFEYKGTIFNALTQSDIMRDMRAMGLSLPPSGYFINDLHNVGVATCQGHQANAPIYRVEPDGRRRKLGPYQTICFVKDAVTIR